MNKAHNIHQPAAAHDHMAGSSNLGSRTSLNGFDRDSLSLPL